ncbi:hypothetical protein [Aquipuribacter hungaricus]|uniref:hypothetical protein n=1 Tax=Aquipuribacter hungaricus TaxID=545624 RepID=UPI0030EBDC4E
MRAEALPTGCLLTGSVGDLSPGRWFLYAEITAPDGVVQEVWLPTPGDGERAAADRQLYEVSQQRTPPWRPVAEVGTLGAAAAILVACLQLSRRASRRTGQPAGQRSEG